MNWNITLTADASCQSSGMLLRLAMLFLIIAGACGCAERDDEDFVFAQSLPAVAAPGSAEAHLAVAPDGTVVMSWLEPDTVGVALRYSMLEGDHWRAPRTIATGADWFVNWADFPSVVPIGDTLWAAHWLVKRPGGVYAYDVAIAISTDAGRSWSESITPHKDGTLTEHGFVSLFPWQGAIGAVWLDGRNMTEDGATHGTSEDGGMTLRSAVIAADGSIIAQQLIDELICDCCQTDVALSGQDPIAVYRDRSEEEIRDIYVTRAIGGRWLNARPVAEDGWEIAGCPVNGPAIAASGDSVAVAWFTAPQDSPSVRLARSSDGGATFAEPVIIDGDRPIGRVDVELLDDGAAVVSWLRTVSDHRGEICVRGVSGDGQQGPVQVIAKTGASRLSGFPQMVHHDSHLILAWTDTSADNTQVHTARVDTAKLKQPAVNGVATATDPHPIEILMLTGMF